MSHIFYVITALFLQKYKDTKALAGCISLTKVFFFDHFSITSIITASITSNLLFMKQP